MKILSTRNSEVQALDRYLEFHPEEASLLAISYQQKYLAVSSEYQKLQTEYLKLKAQTKTPSASPVSTFFLSFIASIKITKLSLRRRRKA